MAQVHSEELKLKNKKQKQASNLEHIQVLSEAHRMQTRPEIIIPASFWRPHVVNNHFLTTGSNLKPSPLLEPDAVSGFMVKMSKNTKYPLKRFLSSNLKKYS